MDPPGPVAVSPKKPDSKPESKTQKPDESGANPKSHECGLCDIEVVYKIAQELLPGLASACVDNTTGGLFKNAGTVAVDMRKEMVDYLTQRSETYVAEFLLSESAPVLETSEHPYDIIITLIDDFTALKRNMFSRVSEWVLSDRREDRIDDFVQEMEVNGFWLLPRRETVASILVKNVDYKNSFHCNFVCKSEEEIIAHRLECKFRAMDCVHEGCTTRYCAAQKENHDANCPFMVLPCEQKCTDFVMRREMDRHCVTICPMKIVNCAFYTVGCKSCIPKCNVQQHNVENLSSHLLFIIRTAHKEAKDDDLVKRVEQIRSLTSTEKLARARDARALTYLIKDAEAKLGLLDPNTESPDSFYSPGHDESNKIDAITKSEPLIVKDGPKSPEKTEVPMKKEVGPPPGPPPPANEIKPSTEKPAVEEVKKEPVKPVESAEKPAKEEVKKEPAKPETTDSKVKTEKSDGKNEASSSSLPIEKKDAQSDPPLKKEVPTDLKKEETKEKPVEKVDAKSEPPLKKEVPTDIKKEETKEKPVEKEGAQPLKKEVPADVKKEETKEKPVEKKDVKKEETKEKTVEKKDAQSEPPLKKEVPKDVKKDETKEKPVEKKDAKSEPPLKKEVPTDKKEETKGKPSDSKEEKKPEESMKSSKEEKSEPVLSSDKGDKKTSPEKGEKGTTEEPKK